MYNYKHLWKYLGNWSITWYIPRKYKCWVIIWEVPWNRNLCLYNYSTPYWSRLTLTHWGRNKMAAISQTTFSNTFSWMKMYEFWLKFNLNLFLRVQLKYPSIGSDYGLVPTGPIIWTWWYSFLRHICVTEPQWFNLSSYMLTVWHYSWQLSKHDIMPHGGFQLK